MPELDTLDLASLEPGYTRDPYPFYADLRASAPVRRVLLHGLAAWLVTRHDDVRQALNDPTLSHDRARAEPAARSAAWLFADERFDLQHHMLRSDPPRHTRIRRLAAQAFTPRRVAELRPRVEEIAHQLIDRFAGQGSAELIADYAFPLPLIVIMEILGVPEDDRDQLRRWSDTCSSGRPATDDAVTGTLTAMRGYLAGLLAGKDRNAADDDAAGGDDRGLLDLLVAAHRDGRLSDAELVSSAFQLLQGGHVTTLGVIANGVLALLLHPDQLARLRADPELVDTAVDELLRFDPPMEIATVRFTTDDVRIGDVVIPGGGEPVILALASANRDPDRFPCPDGLELGRDAGGHLSFGHGAHRCLGAPLARIELAVAFRALVERLDDLTLALDPAELAWRPNPHLRRPERLPVTFTRREQPWKTPDSGSPRSAPTPTAASRSRSATAWSGSATPRTPTAPA